jgi:hypothetical protein
MPYQRPIPDSNPRGKASGLMGSIVQAEKMIQVALILPCAAFICWLGGALLDHMFHTTWIAMAGVVFGILAGLIGAIQLTIKIAGGPGSVKNGPGSDDKQ